MAGCRADSVRVVVLSIVGLGCECSVDELAERLRASAGVEAVEIDAASSTARVRYDENSCEPLDLVAAARRAGCHIEVEHYAAAPGDSGEAS